MPGGNIGDGTGNAVDYDIVSFDVHDGDRLDGGHFRMYLRQFGRDTQGNDVDIFYEINNHVVTEIKEEQFLAAMPHMYQFNYNRHDATEQIRQRTGIDLVAPQPQPRPEQRPHQSTPPASSQQVSVPYIPTPTQKIPRTREVLATYQQIEAAYKGQKSLVTGYDKDKHLLTCNPTTIQRPPVDFSTPQARRKGKLKDKMCYPLDESIYACAQAASKRQLRPLILLPMHDAQKLGTLRGQTNLDFGMERANNPQENEGILVPQVQFVRDDKGKYLENPIDADVYIIDPVDSNSPEYEERTKEKIRGFFRTASREDMKGVPGPKNEILILSPFLFGEDPKVVGRLFGDVLSEEEFCRAFELVAFTIPLKQQESFRQAFQQAKNPTPAT
jgi:hypothetical protein